MSGPRAEAAAVEVTQSPSAGGLVRGAWDRPWVAPVVSGGVALLVRLLYVLELRRVVLFDSPIMDAAVHDGWARGTLDLFHRGIAYFRAPLYPWFLQAVYAVADGYLWPRIVQAVVSALTVALAADIGRRLAGGVAGLAGGLLLALCWPAIYFAGELLIVTLFVGIVMLALWLFVRAGLEDRPGLAYAGSLALGVASLARPTALAFLPVLVAMVVWGWPRMGLSRLAASRPRTLATLLLLALLPGLSLTVRNKIVGDDWVFIASQGGVNFYIGNNPQSDGRTAVVPGTRATWLGGYEDTIDQAQAAAGRPLRPSEISDHYLRKGLTFWREEPGTALKLYRHKLRLLLGAGERSNNKNIHFWRNQSRILRLPLFVSWATLFALGLVGIAIAGRGWRYFPVTGFLLTYALGLLLFFINERFRLPLTALLATTAGIPVSAAIAAAGRREWLRLGAFVVAVVAVFSLSSLDRIGFLENRIDADAVSRYTMANAYLEKGEPESAIHYYYDALGVSRRFHLRGFDEIEPMLRINLVRAYYRARDYEKMRRLLEELDVTMPNETAVGILWGHYYRSQHEFEKAFRYYRSILDTYPDLWEAQLGLGWCQIQSGALQAAKSNFESVLEVRPREPEALAGLGLVEYGAWNNAAKAKRLCYRALHYDPTISAAHHCLGQIYGEEGDTAEMLYHLREAVRLDPLNLTAKRYFMRSGLPLEHPESGEVPHR